MCRRVTSAEPDALPVAVMAADGVGGGGGTLVNSACLCTICPPLEWPAIVTRLRLGKMLLALSMIKSRIRSYTAKLLNTAPSPDGSARGSLSPPARQ
jgi:hypothetical protein